MSNILILHPLGRSSWMFTVFSLSLKNEAPAPLKLTLSQHVNVALGINIVWDKQSYCALSLPSVDSLVPAGGSTSLGTLSRLWNRSTLFGFINCRQTWRLNSRIDSTQIHVDRCMKTYFNCSWYFTFFFFFFLIAGPLETLFINKWSHVCVSLGFMATLVRIKMFYHVWFMVVAERIDKGFYTVTHMNKYAETHYSQPSRLTHTAVWWRCGKHDSSGLWQRQTDHVSSGHPAGFL